MALSATIHKVELSVSDMDRHYYATHSLTLAQHPSETEQRLMARLVAFMLYADERLEFGRGLSDEGEPALSRCAYSGDVELWVEVGQPSETRIRKACGRADQVVVINYNGRSDAIWWEKTAAALARHRNLTVLSIDTETMQQLAALSGRNMSMQCLIEDGELQVIDGDTSLMLRPEARMGRYLVG